MSDYSACMEVEPRVYLIRGLNKAQFPEANSLLIDDEILTLVDAGSSREQVASTMRSLGHRPENLDRIVLTHFHIDHKGHAEYFRELSGCEVICHPLSEKGIRTFEGLASYWGVNDQSIIEKWRTWLQGWLPHVTSDYEITGHYQDMKPITCGEVELSPMHLPGHSWDHTCFGINGFETFFLVDIDLTDFGPFYGTVVSDISVFKQSIKRVIELAPKTGISSHLLDPVTDNLLGRLERFLSVFDRREADILTRISEGHDTIQKLASLPTIYPRIPYDAVFFFEETMLKKHIEILRESGAIYLDGERLVIS